MKQIEVQILGQVYMLGCPEGGETLLRSAVSTVDREMTIIKEAGKVRARERIAVLAALNLAYQIAERGTPAPQGSAADDDTSASETSASASVHASIDAMVQRIDEALAEDGQLL